MKIIIDADPGHDDAMALMLACKSVELDVLAVTTVAGNSTIENTTRNARFILGFIGRNDIPVYSGAARPLRRPLVQAAVHGTSGLAGIDPQDEAHLTNNAVDQILRLVRKNPNEITIVTLAPLTNIAEAIARDPITMGQVKRIVSMGGAISVPGNMNRVAEFNIFVDPEAAEDVLQFEGIPKTFVPLDACNHVQMSLDDFKRVQDVPLRKLLLKMMRPYIINLRNDVGVDAALMYDPLTIFFLLQRQSCKTTRCNVQIETQGELTRGMMIADRRIVTDGLRPNITIVSDIQASDFIKRFIDTLNGLRPER
ncbi:MAG TPA: nucleoside hydrolase [Patescibacteria group bacterium]|nr:nucleoside hydrolase [Patescibacteria group bacterium]